MIYYNGDRNEVVRYSSAIHKSLMCFVGVEQYRRHYVFKHKKNVPDGAGSLNHHFTITRSFGTLK